MFRETLYIFNRRVKGYAVLVNMYVGRRHRLRNNILEQSRHSK